MPRRDGTSSPLEFEWRRRLTARLRLLPDFLILGARCCGTTSLYTYLTAHPSIVAAELKETHFFDDHFHRGMDYYRCHFPAWGRKFFALLRRTPFLTGEATPFYIYHPEVPERVRAALPQARFIVLLRNPVSRAYSHYQQSRHLGVESLSFEEAIRAEPERLGGEPSKGRRSGAAFSLKHHSYVERGIYVDQLLRWFQYFPREQFLILNSERLFRSPAPVTNQVFEFLGLPQFQNASYPHRHSGKYVEPLAPATRESLREYFAPHSQRLFDLLGVSYDWE